MSLRFLTPLLLLLAATTGAVAKSPFPTKKDDTKTTNATRGKDASKDTGKKDATAEALLPVDPFTRIDAVLTGKDADDLHAALTAAESEIAVTKAKAALAASTTKAQDATGSAKAGALAAMKADVRTLFNAEKAAILKANPKLSASIAKVESAKDAPAAR